MIGGIMTRQVTWLLAAIVMAAGCTGGQQKAPKREMTQRQRDSAIGEMKLPGAEGVRRALRVADSAQARANRLDTIQ